MEKFEYAPAPESAALVDIKSEYGLFINGKFVVIFYLSVTSQLSILIGRCSSSILLATQPWLRAHYYIPCAL